MAPREQIVDNHHAEGRKDDNVSTKGCWLSGPPLLNGSHSLRQSRGGKVRTTQMMKQKGQRRPESSQAEIRSKMTIHRKENRGKLSLREGININHRRKWRGRSEMMRWDHMMAQFPFGKNKPLFGRFLLLNLFYANIFLKSSTQRQLEILTLTLIFYCIQ